MMKDREQKAKALRFSVSNRWLPQLEVDVQPARWVREAAPIATDLDVFSSIPDHFVGYRTVVFDCKTKARESAVNRAFWLSGVLQRLNSHQGFCILRKDAIELDHRLLATRLNVVLLAEDEFELYVRATTDNYSESVGHVGDINDWEYYFSIPSRFPKLGAGLAFLRSEYWMLDDPAEACRKTLGAIRSIHAEFDPAHPEHIALVLDFCAIFARSLAIVVTQIFKAYLHPTTQTDLSDALLMMLYGGRDAYSHRNELYKRAKSAGAAELSSLDLSLPEWDRFLLLARQLLDAPAAAQRVPLILKEAGFAFLRATPDQSFTKQLCKESPQAARFALLIADYVCKASRIPNEFRRIIDNVLLPLQPVK
jgi:hypothetical protein